MQSARLHEHGHNLNFINYVTEPIVAKVKGFVRIKGPDFPIAALDCFSARHRSTQVSQPTILLVASPWRKTARVNRQFAGERGVRVWAVIMSVLISLIQHLGLEAERQPLHSDLKINNFTSAVIFHPHVVVTNVHTSWGRGAGGGGGGGVRAVL